MLWHCMSGCAVLCDAMVLHCMVLYGVVCAIVCYVVVCCAMVWHDMGYCVVMLCGSPLPWHNISSISLAPGVGYCVAVVTLPSPCPILGHDIVVECVRSASYLHYWGPSETCVIIVGHPCPPCHILHLFVGLWRALSPMQGSMLHCVGGNPSP